MPATLIPATPAEPVGVPLSDLPPLVTTESAPSTAAAAPADQEAPTATGRPGWGEVALIGTAGLILGLASGLGIGLAVRNAEIRDLRAQIVAATVLDAEVSLANEHLAQVPGGWTTSDDAYSLAREHLARR